VLHGSAVASCALLSDVLCCAVLCLCVQVGGAIETAKPEAPVDVMMGIGGTPEVSSTPQHGATNG
jgi:hypothetical protein